MSHSKNNFGGSIGKEVVIFSTNYLGGFGYSELVKGQFEKNVISPKDPPA